MARGWESKSVESQKEDLTRRTKVTVRRRLTVEEAERARKIDSLQLSRNRVVQDLGSATNPRYRESLQAALAFLDSEIATLLGKS